MTKEQAQRDTIKRFTNLIDGKVLSFASVATILNYYELLLADVKIDLLFNNGITQNFNEECIKEMENEADNYNGDF
jgi:hypothetical protein